MNECNSTANCLDGSECVNTLGAYACSPLLSSNLTDVLSSLSGGDLVSLEVRGGTVDIAAAAVTLVSVSYGRTRGQFGFVAWSPNLNTFTQQAGINLTLTTGPGV